MAELQVVYVNYRANAHLLRSLGSVLACADEVDGLEVTVVDNSDDPAVTDALRDGLDPSATLIVADRNTGFATGCNAGAARGSSRFVLFLNPDTLVVPGTLGALAAVLRRDPDALVGPRHFADESLLFAHAPMRSTRLFDEVHDLWFARGWSRRRRDRYLRARGRLARMEGPVDVRTISGGCIMLARRTWERLGGWNERYWMYGEDADFCVRARRRGHPVLHLPSAPLVHEMEVSAKQLPDAVARARGDGRTRFKREHYGAWLRALERGTERVARTCLPQRPSPWTEARPWDGPRFEAPPGARRWAVEVARSPLFDNCLTAFPDSDSITVPRSLLDWFPPGTWFFRRARETTPDRWATTDLLALEVPTTVPSPTRRSE